MAKIVIWLGPSLDVWNFATALDKGIGGSETAAIHMSRQLALLGHQVVLYANVPDNPCKAVNFHFKYSEVVRITNGVPVDEGGVLTVLPYQKMHEHEPCDLFISSRQPEARRKLSPNCKQAWLWVHDVHCGSDWDNVIGTNYDKILCLSSSAREKFIEYYPGVEEDKVVLTTNAIDPTLFDRPLLMNSEGLSNIAFTIGRLLFGGQHTMYESTLAPLRVTFSSSPDRGLDKLLDLWPRICELALPSPYPPELHVYYGFETWRSIARAHGGVSDEIRIDRLTARMSNTPGVINHGRAGQAEVARSYLHSQLWLYPTDFVETSCITAMEAQAAGCKIVATRCGALPETAPGGLFVDGPTSRSGYDDEFVEAVRRALEGDSKPVTKVPTWSEVATQWDSWIKEIV